MTWPTATVDHAARARILAAAVPSGAVAEVDLDAPFDEVWAWLSDLEQSVPQFDSQVARVWVKRRHGDRLQIVATSRFVPLPLPFDVDLRPGWCFMRARFRIYVVVMTATPLPDGRTRVSHMEGVPLPFTRWLRPFFRRVVQHDVDGIARHFTGRG